MWQYMWSDTKVSLLWIAQLYLNYIHQWIHYSFNSTLLISGVNLSGPTIWDQQWNLSSSFLDWLTAYLIHHSLYGESHLSTNRHHIKHINSPLCINITCEYIPAIQVLTINYHNYNIWINVSIESLAMQYTKC